MNRITCASIRAAFLMIMMLGGDASAGVHTFGATGQLSPYGYFSLHYGREGEDSEEHSRLNESFDLGVTGGMDYFVFQNISVGGIARIRVGIQALDNNQRARSNVSASLGPRFGWNFPLSDNVSLYTRLGTEVGTEILRESLSPSGVFLDRSPNGAAESIRADRSLSFWSSTASVQFRVGLKNGILLSFGPTLRYKLVDYDSAARHYSAGYVEGIDCFLTMGLGWVLDI